jgi:hypothetical protein
MHLRLHYAQARLGSNSVRACLLVLGQTQRSVEGSLISALLLFFLIQSITEGRPGLWNDHRLRDNEQLA